MADFMAKWNITPKLDMLKKIIFCTSSMFVQTFQPLCLIKGINFTSTFYELVKVIIP